jgi:hypothetical protein
MRVDAHLSKQVEVESSIDTSLMEYTAQADLEFILLESDL